MSLLVVKGNIVAALPMKGWYVGMYNCSLICSCALAMFIYIYVVVFHIHSRVAIPLVEKQL